MKTQALKMIQAEAESVKTGMIAPGRVWKVTKRPDGTVERRQLDPKIYQTAQLEAAQKEALALTVRRKFGVSQNEFAAILGISSGTLRNWEQKRRQPTGAAALLLLVAARYPKIIEEMARQIR